MIRKSAAREQGTMQEDSTPPRLVVGSGRSGTTWVLDCLADANELRPIFEPLHPGESALGKRYAYEVLARGDTNKALECYFRDLAACRVRSRWTDYRGLRALLFPRPARFMTEGFTRFWLYSWRQQFRHRRARRAATRRKNAVIKCIRANLMAGWLTQTIGFRTALIVRHPCAVVESQYGSGSMWDPTAVLERYRVNHRFHEVTGGRYLELLNTELTMLQALTLNWVIENQWPVERSQQDGYTVVYYEDLIFRPEISWPHLCDSLGLTHVPDPTLLLKPSQQATVRSVENDNVWRKQRWQSQLRPEQLDVIQDILDATRCALYTTDELEPAARLSAGDAMQAGNDAI